MKLFVHTRLLLALEVAACLALGAGVPFFVACGDEVIENYHNKEPRSIEGVPPCKVDGNNPGSVTFKMSGGVSMAGATVSIQPKDSSGNAQGSPSTGTADTSGNVSINVPVTTDSKTADITVTTISGTPLGKEYRV